MLGFIKRSSKEFKTVDSIIHLYKTLVRPILIYGSIIWSPYRLYLIKELESVQHRLLRYMAFKMGNCMSYDDHNYSDIAALVKLESLKPLHSHLPLSLLPALANTARFAKLGYSKTSSDCEGQRVFYKRKCACTSFVTLPREL